jgi:hypothetical protein
MLDHKTRIKIGLNDNARDKVPRALLCDLIG